MKILFITNTRIGDAILSTGLLSYLVSQYPQAHFTVAAGIVALPIFEAVPQVDSLIPIVKQSYNRHWIKLWWRCVGHHWDLIIDLRGSGVGLFLRKKRLFWRYPKLSKQWHRAKRISALYGLIESPPLKVFLNDEARRYADELLQVVEPQQKLIAVAPAANWSCKMWPTEHFIRLLQQLTSKNGILPSAKIAVLAAKDEQKIVDQFCAAFPSQQVLKVVGESLLNAAACLARCNLFIGNDSGLMHMAAAVDIPTVGLFGPSPDKLYGPFCSRSLVLRTRESHEQLMLKKEEYPRLAESLMTSLTVDMAAKKIENWW